MIFLQIYKFLSLFAEYKLKILNTKSFIKYPYYLINPKYCQIGKRFSSGPGLRLEAWDNYKGYKYSPNIQIGDNVSINYNVHIGAVNKITIADNVLIGSNVLITDHSHGDLSQEIDTIYKDLPLYSKGPVVIEKNVWIGENVSIMPNVTIGANCVIGANSVVTKSIEPNSVVGGNPAKILKKINFKGAN